ncbi:MAG: M48 family metallopeptidase [Sulfuricella denitrificans]|nr:M48 family metallopeptidase [Sulfuricella denitrificans]
MLKNVKLVLAAALLLAILAGCATNPVTGRSQLMLVSGQEAVASSYQAYSAMTASLQQQSKINRDAAKVARIRAITGRLIPHALAWRSDAAGWKWEVNVIDGPEVNAFCMAGGKMAIYSGFFDQMSPSDDELAQVMAHEIAHALSDHTREKMSMAMASDLGVQLLATGAQASQGQTQMAHALALYVIQMPNSRTAESEADRIGIELAARAGYDPEAAISLWKKMSRLGGGPPQWLSTHPSNETRIAELSRLVPRVEPLYREARGKRQPVYSF